MNEVSNLPEPYEVTYNSRTGRYEFRNSSQMFGFAALIYSKGTQTSGTNIPTIPDIIENGNGAWRLLGLMTGPDIRLIGDGDEIPGASPGNPDLQYATQLFIKTSLGDFWPKCWAKRKHVYFKARNNRSAAFCVGSR